MLMYICRRTMSFGAARVAAPGAFQELDEHYSKDPAKRMIEKMENYDLRCLGIIVS